MQCRTGVNFCRGVRVLAALALLVAMHSTVPVASAQDTITAFVNVSVVPMDRERVLAGQTVVVRGGTIVAMGPTGRTRIPKGATRVDGRGRFLIPGLADMHAHVPSLPRTIQWLTTGTSPFAGDGMAEAERMLRLNVLNGVTTVRLMYGSPETLTLRARAANGELLSPRIYTASLPLYPTDGFVQPAGLRSVNDAVDFVNAARAAGYDFIKMYGLTGELFDTVVAAARRAGIPIAGHVPDDVDGLPKAVQAGYRSIEHLIGFPPYLLNSQEIGERRVNGWPVTLPLDPVKLRRMAVALQRAGVWSCPTLLLWTIRTLPVDSLKKLPEQRYANHTVSQATFARYDTMAAAQLAAMRADARAVAATRDTIVQALHEAGAGLLLGTDASDGILVPGFAVHHELQALVEAGLTPYEALLTGTRNVAAYFDTVDSTGTIAAGKRADLVLLNGNPLEDIRHTADIAGVMLHGRWLGRAELDRQLKALDQGMP